MRFLRTKTMEYLPDDEVKVKPKKYPEKYAILSHTWGKGEVLAADIVSGTAHKKLAYDKVKAGCQRAAVDGYDFIWIDNCCIDKSSSAELSEAINSMFMWYQQADICYAYLSDIPSDIDAKAPEFEGILGKAKWFARGWTLQELIAPANIIFFSQDWTVIGDKKELSGVLSRITKIDEDILGDYKRMYSSSVAKRMSWAAGRETTRPEDRAYCLMGIFGVNMPMVYGEGGTRAFLRLQEEIMKQSDDQSLFAWVDKKVPDSTTHGLLADSPSAFRYSNTMLPYEDWEPRPPYSMTNRGLCIELPLSRLNDDIWQAALDCPVPPHFPDRSFLGIYLRKLPVGHQQYVRVQLGRFTQVNRLGAPQTIYIHQSSQHLENRQRAFPRHILQLRKGPSPEDYKVVKMITLDLGLKTLPQAITTSRGPSEKWVPGNYTFSMAKAARHLTLGIIFEREEEQILVMLGSSVDFGVGFDVRDLEIEDKTTFEHLQTIFQPSDSISGNIFLRNGTVKITIQSHDSVSKGDMYYMVDIELMPNAKPPPRISMLDRIGDLSFEPFGGILNVSSGLLAPLGEYEEMPPLEKKSIWNRVTKSKPKKPSKDVSYKIKY